jgi:YD repeat-containing protein
VRHYEYNPSGQLKTYTDAGGGKTEYGYDANGSLNKITVPDGTIEAITSVAEKVSEATWTPPGGTPSGAKFSYQVPTSPCKPATDAGETVVTMVPSGEAETLCFDSTGHFTGPKTESEAEEEGEGTPPEIPAGTCYEKPEPPADCGEEDLPPETESRAPSIKDLKGTSYGVADNNWLQAYPPNKEEEEHKQVPNGTVFPYFDNHSIQSLTVTRWRRTVPWDLMLNVEAGENQAKAWRADLEKWIEHVKALGGQPLVSFDVCPADRTWDDPEIKVDSEDDIPCSTTAPGYKAPGKKEYTASVAKFLEQPVLKEVKYFTAFNEPNRPGIPTVANGKLAGEYWQALDGLCNPKRNNCYVAAGEFNDKFMADAYHKTLKGLNNPAYKYFQEYLKGMNHPATGYRWAWHAYTDGEHTQSEFRGRTNRWWRRFQNFLSAINRASEHAKFPVPEIWLTEQGVVYERFENGKPVKAFAGRTTNPGPGDEILRAYVEHGTSQLTRQSKQITRFYYYETRGAKGFDSGLLEAEPPLRNKAANAVRSIYGIYKAKTTKRP